MFRSQKSARFLYAHIASTPEPKVGYIAAKISHDLKSIKNDDNLQM